MNISGAGNFYKKILTGGFLAAFLLLNFISKSQAADKDDKKDAYAPTPISIDRTALMSDENSIPKEVYGISLDIDRESLAFDSVSYKTITQLSSKPNSAVNIMCQVPGSKQIENKNGSATIILRSDNSLNLRAKISTDKILLNFDEKGKSEFTITSEFFPSNKQPNGTYRGVYYLVMAND